MKLSPIDKKKFAATKTDTVQKLQAKEFPIVAIGASAGGLEAMTDLLQNLSHNTGMAFIYVQHLSPDHESILASLLAKATRMKVQQATHKEKMLPDNVYVIPPDTEMNILDGHIALSPRPEIPKVNLPIDILFSSLAEKHKENVIGIILSGSASDGTRGLQAIKYEGGITFAQDDSAKFNSMPTSAIAAGAVDFILSPKEIAHELEKMSKHPLLKSNGRGKKNGREKEVEIEDKDPDLSTILRHLHKQTGVDFTLYKMNTIKRRIQRRILLNKIKSLKEYVKLITEKNQVAAQISPSGNGKTGKVSKNESELLFSDLLITVTNFFRDAEACKYLKTTSLPKLLKNKDANEALRIWIPACSTGEEAYSVAIMLVEIQDKNFKTVPIQIFATDLSEPAVSKARIGVYTKPELENVSAKRLQRFFTKSGSNFRIGQAIRDMCVFAPHNLLSDPPFSHLDLISCCNLLIYFDMAAQKKAFATFHYALNDEGCLMLGKSESTGQSANLFSPVNKKLKLYQRKKNSGIGTLPAPDIRYSRLAPTPNQPAIINQKGSSLNLSSGTSTSGFDAAINSVLLSHYVPASVVINQHMEILQFRGETNLYLGHGSGKASLNILKMARPEISFELRNAITRAFKTKKTITKKGIEMNGGRNLVSLDAIPVTEWEEPLLLILFTEQHQDETLQPGTKKIKQSATASNFRKIKKLEEEMSAYRDELRSVTHNHEAALEELQSANEEVVSSNEELRSINEELETSKEEIQSANEELATTNQELQTRNDLLNESYNYAEAIIGTVHDPMLILDKDLRVKTANRSFYKNFRAREDETEGLLLYDLGHKQWNIPKLRELLEDIIPKNSSFHDFEVEHDFPGIGKKIMLLNANRIIQRAHREQLILLSIADITEIRQLSEEKELAEKKALQKEINDEKLISDTYKAGDAYIRNVFMQAPVSIVVYKGPSFIVDMINEKGLEMWGTTYKKVIGKPLFEISPELQKSMEKILSDVYIKGDPYIANEFPAQYKRDGIWSDGFFNFVLNPVHDLNGTIIGITSIGTDVTQEVIARKLIEESEKNLRNILEGLPQLAWRSSPDGMDIFFNRQWYDYTGQTEEESKNEGWADALHPDDREWVFPRWRKTLEDKTPIEVEYRLRSTDGTYHWFLTRAAPFFDAVNNVNSYIGTCTNIDAAKRIQEELQQGKQRREEFIKMASHELKTPITTIKGYIQLVLRTVKDEEKISPLLVKSSLLTMEKQVNRLTRLMAELLDLSRIETGRLDLNKESFSLNALVIEIVEDILYTNTRYAVNISHDFECSVFADKDRIGQVISNLITNAIKYSPIADKIEVRIFQAGKNGVAVSVEDHGIGIDKKEQEKIFERFYRAEGPSEQTYPGFGVGLFLAAEIIQRHNGSIAVESEKGKGSTFTFILPVEIKK